MKDPVSVAKSSVHFDKLNSALSSSGVSITDRRLRQLAREGYFPEPVRGEYEFLATLLGLIRYYRELYGKKSGGIQEEEHRQAIAKRKIMEVQAARAQEEVEETAEVERSRIALVMLVRQKLLALPSQAASYLACCDTQQRIESELERQIEKILADLEKPEFEAVTEKAAGPVAVTENGAGEQPGA